MICLGPLEDIHGTLHVALLGEAVDDRRVRDHARGDTLPDHSLRDPASRHAQAEPRAHSARETETPKSHLPKKKMGFRGERDVFPGGHLITGRYEYDISTINRKIFQGKP